MINNDNNNNDNNNNDNNNDDNNNDNNNSGRHRALGPRRAARPGRPGVRRR